MSLHNVPAPAKLNLFLNVVGRRSDGYHLLESLFVFTPLADRLGCHESERDFVEASHEFASVIRDEPSNLITRARDLLRDHASISDRVAIQIDKVIPVAAGLGGGSADAAATLRMLNEMWDLNWPVDRLLPLARELGADVPACLVGQPVIARGIGDQMEAAPALPPYSVLLVNPRVETPTPKVFKAFAAANPVIASRDLTALPSQWPDLAALADFLSQRGNDLIPAAIATSPAITEVLGALAKLPGAAYSSLSGSGATCFTLFETDAQAISAGKALARQRPDWWFWWPDKEYR